MQFIGGHTLSNVSCNLGRNDIGEPSCMKHPVRARFLLFKQISQSRATHYSNRFRRFLTYLYILSTCIWLADICVFPTRIATKHCVNCLHLIFGFVVTLALDDLNRIAGTIVCVAHGWMVARFFVQPTSFRNFGLKLQNQKPETWLPHIQDGLCCNAAIEKQ